ncbi:hypothetical protein C5167_041753 [Papaver somniferum]|nr:hypothetical protein C5167_041753 [Papaver somniferum]
MRRRSLDEIKREQGYEEWFVSFGTNYSLYLLYQQELRKKKMIQKKGIKRLYLEATAAASLHLLSRSYKRKSNRGIYVSARLRWPDGNVSQLLNGPPHAVINWKLTQLQYSKGPKHDTLTRQHGWGNCCYYYAVENDMTTCCRAEKKEKGGWDGYIPLI